jgi:hypothetical protein
MGNQHPNFFKKLKIVIVIYIYFIIDMEKPCNVCGIIKPLDQYRECVNKNGTSSHRSTCKTCTNEYDKKREKERRATNRATLTAICEMCGGEETLNKFAKLKKNYKHKICLECYPQFVTKQKTEWCRKEHNSNVNYRIKKSLAARLRTVLTKTDTTMNYIGCNIQYMREWIEYNFTPEMNWKNYGSYWSIDHIIPVNRFDLTDNTEKLKCWNWSNLTPVTVKYNSSKKNVDLDQVNNTIIRLEKFKEEGSTTKWFSGEFILSLEFAKSKMSSS